MKRLWPLAAITAVAVLIWAPTLLIAHPGDSFSYDLNWSRQFTHLFWRGELYPRWTGASFEGLGAPTFYFYPPLAFWVTALIGGAAGGWASAALQVKLAELFFIALSGWTMFLWLRPTAGRLAIAGAILFMLAPYHLDDHYVRGAFAELSAIAMVPLALFGLASIARNERLGATWLALG